jgi:hypothetical protein
LGIDISDGRINLALVRKNGDGVKLLRAASGPVPDGAIKDGNVEDATVLAKAIKKLKTKNRIHSHRTVFSLVANPTLMQILDLPKDARGNVRQFVQDEVKHYAVLPINKAAVDFCGIKSSPKSSNHRVLVVASDSQKITAAARAFNREGLNIDAIEPAWVAYIRACYAKKIAKKFDTSLLFAIVCDRTLTLSVFRNQTLDFVRTERIEPATLQSEEYFEWLAEEINAVIKFYELEVHDEHNKWHVTLVANISGESVSEATESLRARLDPVELEVRTLEHAGDETSGRSRRRSEYRSSSTRVDGGQISRKADSGNSKYCSGHHLSDNLEHWLSQFKSRKGKRRYKAKETNAGQTKHPSAAE